MVPQSGFGSLANSIIITLVGIISTFAIAWFWFQKNQSIAAAKAISVDHELVKARLATAEAQLARIDQVVVPINTMMQQMLVRELTHYHTPEMDGLMAKLGPPSTLTADEVARLVVLLAERTKDMGPLISGSERGAATILPVIMERAAHEQATIAGAEKMKAALVSIVSVVGVPLAKNEVADKP